MSKNRLFVRRLPIY